MPDLALQVLLLLFLAAMLAGFIDAIAGGGGLLTSPALLTAGLPPHLVLGTNKLCATFGSGITCSAGGARISSLRNGEVSEDGVSTAVSGVVSWLR